MNERIKELAEQAGLAQVADVYDGYIYPEGMGKFAELIVKECANIAKIKVFGLSTFENAEEVEEHIKQHFGVER